MSDEDCADKTEIRKELSSLSFEELQKLKEEMGTKLYNEAFYGKTRHRRKDFHRENKNRPREISSKKPAQELESSDIEPTKLRVDPRFGGLSGSFKCHSFARNYAFLSEIEKRELNDLKKKIKSASDPETKKELTRLLDSVQNKLSAQQKKRQEEMNHIKERQEQVNTLLAGKQPFFKKKSEQTKEHLVNKYSELKKSGKLENYIRKKRKRLASKQKKKFLTQ